VKGISERDSLHILRPGGLEYDESSQGEQMSTPSDDNDKLISFIAATVETMRDQMATKDDLKQLEARFEVKLKAEITAVRGDIEQVHIRLDNIERTLSTRLN